MLTQNATEIDPSPNHYQTHGSSNQTTKLTGHHLVTFGVLKRPHIPDFRNDPRLSSTAQTFLT